MKNKIFEAVLLDAKLPLPAEEFQFNPGRKWRADYCWHYPPVILEVEGGVFTQGRHTRGKGFLNDMEKYNSAALMGYRIIRVIPADLLKTKTIDLLKSILK